MDLISGRDTEGLTDAVEKENVKKKRRESMYELILEFSFYEGGKLIEFIEFPEKWIETGDVL